MKVPTRLNPKVKFPKDRVPRFHRVQLPCGFAFTSVTKDIKPETIKALDEMARTARIAHDKGLL